MATQDVIFYTAKVRRVFLLLLYQNLTLNVLQICPYAQRVGTKGVLPRVDLLTRAATGGARIPRGES